MQESLTLRPGNQGDQPLLDFFAKFKLRYYKRGEILLRSDDVNEHTYFIKKGYVVTYSISPKGYRDVRSFSRPFTFFPIKNFFTPVTADAYLPSRTVYIEALTDVYLTRAPQDEFTEFVKNNPDAQVAILKQSSLNQRFTMARLEMLQLRDVRLKILALFLSLAFAFGRPKGNGSLIEAPISHQLIADSLSLARETVSRELIKLKKAGLVGYSPHSIEIYDLEKIKKMVEEY